MEELTTKLTKKPNAEITQDVTEKLREEIVQQQNE
jgi:hypothetical protein